MAILLADDDAQLATFLSKSLESEGYSVHTAPDEAAVFSELKRQNYQLIILDLNLGNTDGLKLLEELRTHGIGTPVMVLSARDRVADRIQSLNSGADDYVTKPFSFQELAARVKAVLRRKADPALNILRVEDLELDPVLRRVQRGAREIKLSPKEFDLLHLMMRRGGEVIGRQDLLRECWGAEPETDSNLVDVYVNYLRKKVDGPEEPKLIQTVRGTGYRLGRQANVQNGAGGSGNVAQVLAPETYPISPTVAAETFRPPTNALIHSIAHDLAQPLTTVRCFLEMQGLPKSKPVLNNADLNTIEQQADRAIAISKAISALVRDVHYGAGETIDADALLNEVLADFATLTHNKLLIVRREWQETLRVTSSANLRQALIFLICKLVGRITQPLELTFGAEVGSGSVAITAGWSVAEADAQCPDAQSVFGKDLAALQQLLIDIGGQIKALEPKCMLSLLLAAD
jgi:two-component system OmpR family response regulator